MNLFFFLWWKKIGGFVVGWKVDMETMEMVGDAGKEMPDDKAGEAFDPLEVGFPGNLPGQERWEDHHEDDLFFVPNVGGETSNILVMVYRWILGKMIQFEEHIVQFGWN